LAIALRSMQTLNLRAQAMALAFRVERRRRRNIYSQTISDQ